MHRIERRKAVTHVTTEKVCAGGGAEKAAGSLARRLLRALRLCRRSAELPSSGAASKAVHVIRLKLGADTVGKGNGGIAKVRSALSKLSLCRARTRLSAQSLATWVIVAILAGCAGAEAKPTKDRITIRLGIAENAFAWCDAHAAWQIAHAELARVARGRVAFDLEHDMEFAEAGPALTVAAFWDSSLYHYWRSKAPTLGGIRWVALPALVDEQGRKLYGGMSGGSFFFSNVEAGNPTRNALVVLHELAHIIGKCADICQPGAAPNLMCPTDAGYLKAHPELLHYDAICERKIRDKLGLKTRTKTICIGGGCK